MSRFQERSLDSGRGRDFYPQRATAQMGSGFSANRTNVAGPSNARGNPTQSTTFRAPAHKHAHHLHSIPPREKSTRTLIIDHMLWVHGRTRFSQARAELGMTDRSGGSSSPNYIHRHRPENFEEEEEEQSNGEDVPVLKARTAHQNSFDEHQRHRDRDLALAKSLKARAETVEKVVTSMLDQPPTEHPPHGDDVITPPTSPKMNMSNQRDIPNPHTLPNGVRFRLALGTIINDLFSREANLALSSGASFYSAHYNSDAPSHVLPSVLQPLFQISAIRKYDHNSLKYDATMLRIQPGSRSRSLYSAGTSFISSAKPKCPRHLQSECAICIEPKPSTASSRARAGSLGTVGGIGIDIHGRRHPSTSGVGRGGITGWQDGSGIGSGLARAGVTGTVLRRSGLNVAGYARLSDFIPRFLRLSALVAAELGTEARNEELESSEEDRKGPTSPTSSPTNSGIAQNKACSYTLRPTKEWYLLLAGLLTRAVLEGYAAAGWKGLEPLFCLLQVGLGTTPNDTGIDRAKEDDDRDSSREGYQDLEPDEFPTLIDATDVLFPLGCGASAGEGAAEIEYRVEMEERLRKFCAISDSTPDLQTHLNILGAQYPTEPVERAAVRFFEAIAKWRGKPELETYKKKSSRSHDPTMTPDSSTMTIESLVHSNPTSPTSGNIASSKHAVFDEPRESLIERYFIAPPVVHEDRWSRNKRTRSPEESRTGTGKRMR